MDVATAGHQEFQPQGQVSQRAGEPIAIIGLGARFPAARSPDEYWRLLQGGVDAIREVPPERWDIDRYHSEDPSAEGKMTTRFGGFLEGLDLFDNTFFGISAKEAARMDPQQRLMLEIAWEAFEDAGLIPEALAGSKTGVFIGAMGSEYGWPQARDPRLVTAYSPTGSAVSVIANRLSYFFDLGGPSLSLDTACSSSLVAVTLACRSIWAGEAELALAGGVTAILSPAPTIGMSKLTALAPDGRCKAFDARANGYVRSEGAGVVVLKPLSRALADGDALYAVIRGFAVNNDGKTNGLTAPNRLAQERLLTDAYASASIDPGSVHYIEAHGTGTLLGDPIEAAAIGAVVGARRQAPCLIGSVKTNIGHLEGAAGIAGLIKVCLMLHHREIPRSLHFQTPNPHIPFDKLGLRVATEHQPWPAAYPARAGVSAFGFGGTNCHVVLEEAPAQGGAPTSSREQAAPRPELLLLSARTEAALLARARAYRELLTAPGLPPLPALCRTAALRRTHHEHRAFAVGSSADELRERLDQLLGGQEGLRVGQARSQRKGRLKVAFIYPGLGPQWEGMAQGLLRDEPLFREAIARVDALVRQQAGWSVLAELEGDHAGEGLRAGHIQKIQTTLFAIQVALGALWTSWGVVPDAVVGHSMGEVAAAVMASVLTLEDAVRVMLERSRLLHASSGHGAMAAVELGVDEALALVRGLEQVLSVAASNSPGTTVLSGDARALEDILRGLEARGTSFRMVRTSGVAGHGPQLEEARHTLTAALTGIAVRSEALPLYSTKTGERGARLDARYWGDQLREPVFFSQAIERMRADGVSIFIELSPHPTLAEDVRRCFAARGAEAVVLPSLRRNEDERGVLLGTLGRLHVMGRSGRLAALFPTRTPPVRLPAYPWQRSRFWLDIEDTVGEPEATAPVSRVSDEATLQQIREDRWLYTTAWRAMPRAPGAPRSAEGYWLVFCDGRGTGGHLAARLGQAGTPCVRVLPGASFARPEPRTFIVPPGDAEALVRLFEELAGQGLGRCQGIVHLWSLEIANGSEPGDESAPAHALTWRSLLALVQALARRGESEAPRLWITTRGAQAPDGTATTPNPLHHLVWGLGRSLAHEMPAAWGGLVDLDPSASPEESAKALAGELLGGGEEDQVVLRGAARYVARLVRASLPPRRTGRPPLRKDAAYLITGGLGALGLLVARYLAERGARRLILLGRTPLPEREHWTSVREGEALHDTLQGLLAIERLGAHVRTHAVDVADAPQLDAFLARYRREGHPPIAGVFHAAGIVRDQLLANLDSRRFFEVLRPKVLGAWNLHRALRDEPLDHFVLFSSAVGTLGSAGQANYAAANAYLDGLAQLRRAEGRCALSIAWGPWAGAGLAHRPDRGGRLALRGLRSLTPEAGIAVLNRLLQHAKEPFAAVLDASWPDLFAAYGHLADRPFYAELRAASPAPVPPPAALDAEALARKAPASRHEVLVGHLRALLGKAVGSAPETIDEHRPLNQLGLDSLMVMELSQRLKSALGVRVSPRLFARETSLHELATHLLELLKLTEAPSPDEPTSLARSPAPARAEWIQRPTPRAAAPARAFCFAYAGASPWVFHGLSRVLPEGVELCVVQLPGRGTRVGEPLVSELAGLEGPLVDALTPWLDKPFVLFGYSLGGLVAFETARALRRRALRGPEALLVAASRAPHLPDPFPELRELDDARFVRELRRFGGTPEEALRDAELMMQVLPVLRADFGLIRSYRFRQEPPLDCAIQAFGGTRDEVVRPDELRGWAQHARRFELCLFDEAHFFLKPREAQLAEAISRALDHTQPVRADS